MSRVADNPIELPKGVEAKLAGQQIDVTSAKGSLSWVVNNAVDVAIKDNVITFAARDGAVNADALAGTSRALVNNMVTGVSQGFEKKLTLIGVGYRAKLQGKELHLTLGFSHPVVYPVPQGITIELPSQTEILVKGIDKQSVGQVAAEIRAYRPPEPYKGKGVRYADEVVHIKEGKKK